MKKTVYTLLFLFISYTTNCQQKKSSKMGQASLKELKMVVYDKDSTATAVTLYEHANHYIDRDEDYNFRTDYYFRIKIFDKQSFDLANIVIDLYKKKRATNIKAITYNFNESDGLSKTELLDKDIFTEEYDDDYKLKKFTLPNIKKGCVIEYSYSILSPYLQMKDWYFQSDIPTIKSEYDFAMIANYAYSMRLIGVKKLDKNESSIKKNCIYIDGIGEGDCSVFSFGMNDIPAFKEEDHMLSKKNYLSRISFDLTSATGFRGAKSDYATTWKDADKSLKKFFFNNQTSKKTFFKKQLSEAILTTDDQLEKAKKIFKFIQNHYTWNGDYWTNEDAKIKDAFAEKTGDVGEINLSLYNCLQAADIKANLVVLSTRSNGIATKVYPIIFDFNYVIVQIKIDGKGYFLDATSSFLPFGEVPVRTLNGEARVIDFKEKSEWIVLKPNFKSHKNTIAKLALDVDGEITGNLLVQRSGYFAEKLRATINNTKKEDYLEDFENENPDVEVEDYEIQNEDDLKKSLVQKFNINLSLDEVLGMKTRINPFFFDRLKENPFKLKERSYPVDFAFPRKSTYILNIVIPEEYAIVQLPENIAFALPNKGGKFILNATQSKNAINIYARIDINKKVYSSEEYYYLKEFYKRIIISESSYIILEKKKT